MSTLAASPLRIPLPLRLSLDFVRWLFKSYLVRVPVVSAALLIAAPLIALYWQKSLLENLFVMDALSVFWVTVSAYVLAWTIQITYRVTILHRHERFGGLAHTSSKTPGRTTRLTTRLLPLPLICGILWMTRVSPGTDSIALRLFAAFCGLVGSYFLSFGATLLTAYLAPHNSVNAEHYIPVYFHFQKVLLRLMSKAEPFRGNNPCDGVKRRLARLRKLTKALHPDGYFDSTGKLYGGHWLAIVSFTLSATLYTILGWLNLHQVPALCYILLLHFLLTWLLAGAAFFFDRYRIPLAVPIGLMCLISSLSAPLQSVAPWLPSSDHFYNIERREFEPPPQPPQILQAFQRKTNNRIILVASAGGGIQAAAWTAQVLAGLQAEAHGGTVAFADSVAAMSGVSGGAVGVMFFNHHYSNNPGRSFPRNPKTLERIVEDAEYPSLSEVAWGLTNPDLMRIFFPWTKWSRRLKLSDRGEALENVWRKRAKLNEFLSDWIPGVETAMRPAVIFNSTKSETGEPLLMTTTSILDTAGAPKLSSGKKPHLSTFYVDHKGYDLRVVTAARLAASFPYVTPAARPFSEHEEYHQVDGGYYDNYGISSLLNWLNQALCPDPDDCHPVGDTNILVIRIVSFPDDSVRSAVPETWMYQSYAPIDTLFNVRSTSQLLRDNEILRTFEKRWAGRGATIHEVPFQFLGKSAPLSWQMNKEQVEAIGAWWNRADTREQVQKVSNFLSGK